MKLSRFTTSLNGAVETLGAALLNQLDSTRTEAVLARRARLQNAC